MSTTIGSNRALRLSRFLAALNEAAKENKIVLQSGHLVDVKTSTPIRIGKLVRNAPRSLYNTDHVASVQ